MQFKSVTFRSNQWQRVRVTDFLRANGTRTCFTVMSQASLCEYSLRLKLGVLPLTTNVDVYQCGVTCKGGEGRRDHSISLAGVVMETLCINRRIVIPSRSLIPKMLTNCSGLPTSSFPRVTSQGQVFGNGDYVTVWSRMPQRQGFFFGSSWHSSQQAHIKVNRHTLKSTNHPFAASC